MGINTLNDLTTFLERTAANNRDVTISLTPDGVRVVVSNGPTVRRNVSWIEIVLSDGRDLEGHIKLARAAMESMRDAVH